MSKILIDEATVKLALEALEEAANILTSPMFGDAATALKALAEQPAQQCKWPTCQSEEAQQALAEQIKRELVGEQPAHQEFVLPGGGYVPAIPAQQALDKKAENARELGLDYELAQQEPVAVQSVMTVRIWRDKNSDQNAEFKNWHKLPDGEHILYTSPPAQRTWVGLTDEEIMAIGREMGLKCRLGGSPNIDFDYAEAIEAKLNEKNT